MWTYEAPQLWLAALKRNGGQLSSPLARRHENRVGQGQQTSPFAF